MSRGEKGYDAWKYISHLQKLESIYARDFAKEHKKVSEKLKSVKLKEKRKKLTKNNLAELDVFLKEE